MKKDNKNLALKIIGPFLMIVGIILIILACTVLRSNSFTLLSSSTPNFGVLVFGCMLMFFSIPISLIAYVPNLSKSKFDSLKNLYDRSLTMLDEISQPTKQTKKTKKCPYCSSILDEDEKSCPNCGAKQ